MKKTFIYLVAATTLAFSSFASAASAASAALSSNPDFNLNFTGLGGGDLTGVAGAWATGEDININVLTVSGAAGMPSGITVADITGGLLNFDTTNGTFEITGAVEDLNINDDSTILFSSTLYGWQFVTTSIVDAFGAGGTGFADDALLTALGELASANPFAFGGFSIESTNGVITGTNFLATSTGDRTPEVPVPAAVWLFGSGLLGLIGVARRKSHA